MNNGIEKIAEENAKPDNNVQERSLTAHETDKLVEYISLAAKRRQEYTKNKNWLIIHPHFLTPSSGMVNLPLDDPRSEYQYFSDYIRIFSEILAKGRVTDEDAKKFRLDYSKGNSGD